MSKQDVVVIGRFPPPVDGQSLVTDRLATTLSDDFRITTVNSNTTTSYLNKLVIFSKLGGNIKSVLDDIDSPVIIWPSVSPRFFGHLRDMVSVVRACADAPIIAVIHWGNFEILFQQGLLRGSVSRFIERISRFVFLDDSLANRCAEWIPTPKRISIPNILDDSVLCSELEANDKLNRPSARVFKVLYLSNMIRSKGYIDVIAAASILRESHSSIEFHFVGEWLESSSDFDSAVKKNELSSTVTHHGQISDRNEVKQFMLEADAFVLPTYYENEAQPSSIIEAMSAGTPVITCDQGGISDMLSDHQSELLVDQRNPHQIADRIKLLTDPEIWLSHCASARRQFNDKFHPEIIKQQWIDLVRQVDAEY